MAGRNERALFTISVAARLAGMHPQTLRQYDRLGLVSPHRTPGRGRRYTAEDIATLREVQRMSQEEGINLAGIKRILTLQREAARLRVELETLRAVADPGGRVFAATASGDVVAVPRGRRPLRPSTGALVVWRGRPNSYPFRDNPS